MVGRVRIAFWILPLLPSATAWSQELELRAYSPDPVGNFVPAGYGQSTGSVLFDPSLPFDDGHARLDSAVLGYGRTFGLFGRSATVLLAVPYVWGSVRICRQIREWD